MTRSSSAWVVALTLFSACKSTNRQTPPATTAAPVQGTLEPAVSHPEWRPLHKGGGDLSTGIYTREDDDLVVNTPLPIVLRRTFNSGDGFPRQFGANTTHTGEWWLYGDGDPRVPWADLILANGGRIHFVRISPGNTQEGAVLRHDSTPTEFNGALLTWVSPLWELRFRDGSVASFLDCQTDDEKCSLVERRDADGHRIVYVRDRSGTLLRMESDGQYIAFEYDHRKRIVRAYDSQRREVSYAYDDRGRLVRATGSDGTVRTYDYDERDRLVDIREPRRIIQNWFDSEGRWAKQVVKSSDDDDDPYVATVQYTVRDGAIVEVAFDQGNGLEVTRYNSHHYIVSETFRSGSAAPIVFSYNRDVVSNRLNDVTMSCVGPSGSMTRRVPLLSDGDDAKKWALMRESCVAQR